MAIKQASSSQRKRSNRRPAGRVEQYIAQVPGLNYGVLDTLVGYALRRAQLRIYQDFDRTVHDWAITPPRFSAMTLLFNNPGLKLTDLAHAMGIARSGAVEVVNALEALGYVQRTPSATDARAHALELTPEGQLVYTKTELCIREHDARVCSGLSPQDQRELVRLLGLLGTGGDQKHHTAQGAVPAPATDSEA